MANEQKIPISLGEEAWMEEVIDTTHDAVIHRKGGSRYDTTGNRIRPMGTAHAADLAGWSVRAVTNSLDSSQETVWPSFRAFLRWVYHGLDISVLRTMLRPRRIAVFQLPDISSDDDLSIAAEKVAEEMGDVFRRMAESRRKDSPGGKKIVGRERAGLILEAEDVVAAAAAMLDAFRYGRSE